MNLNFSRPRPQTPISTSASSPPASSFTRIPPVAPSSPQSEKQRRVTPWRHSANESSSSDGGEVRSGHSSPPPAYTPRRKKKVPIGMAISAPTLTRDGPKREGDNEGRFDEEAARKKKAGWKKIAAAVVLGVVVLGVALGVGLGVGLRRKSKGNTAEPGTGIPASPAPTKALPFPLGSWSLATFLTNVSTACTSNAATWTCYPYSTYASGGASSSATTLDWVISSSSASTTSNSSLLISTSQNPFSLSFTNVTLTLHDANTGNERYSFSTPLAKQVWPTVALTPDNARDTCFYNNSMLTATMYTNRPATLLQQSNGTAGNAGGFTAWPGAVLVEQTSAGGASVPDCYRTSNGAAVGQSVNAQAGLMAQTGSDVCSCVYENAGLEGAG